MTDYIRKIVSGNKARFKDGELNLELDLVYVTDQVVIMGYPAAGVEGFYRNRREDAIKFLEHRHGKNFWVFNFCPIRENSYSADVFGGRVSRYPFPDHHAPPLAIMPLVAREIHSWLSGSSERVAVLHCKAGKGRSGTMACAYLLARDDEPTPPKFERSYSTKQWAKLRTERLMDAVPEDEGDAEIQRVANEDRTPPRILEDHDLKHADTPKRMLSSELPLPTKKSYKDTLNGVLDLHTSRRMKPASSPGNIKHGVSIPSQRRWLYYWALILAHDAPAQIWPTISPKPPSPKVSLTEIRLRMREASTVKIGLVRAANMVMEYSSSKNANISKLSTGKRGSQIWASLARYDDEFVDLLEEWELHTRDENGHMGQRRKGSEEMDGKELNKLFEDGKWDKSKMVRSFARMGANSDGVETNGSDEKILEYTLRPLEEATWKEFRDELQPGDVAPLADSNIPKSESNSMYDLTQNIKKSNEKGVIVDSSREVRVKLYMGQVFMGWFWFIPAFHMPPPGSQRDTQKFLISRKEIDFPLGIGSAIVDVEVSLEWLSYSGVRSLPRETSTEMAAQGEGQTVGVLPVLLGDSVANTVEANQATED